MDWRAEAVSTSYPEPYQRLYVRGLAVEGVSPLDTRVPACEERFDLDRNAAFESFSDALSGLGIFKDVTFLPKASEGPQEDGLVLDLSLEESALLHTGETGSGAFWLWLFTGYPGLCVHDQLYTVFYDARARISDARTGETLVPWEPLAGPTPESYALNFHERTTGFTPYLECWIIPPTSIGIDQAEVARKVLPPAIRPTVQSLVRIFNQITFAPVNKVEVLIRPAMGIRVDDVSAPVTGGVATITVHATLAPGVWLSYASCGDVKLDLSKEQASQLEKPIEIVLPGVAIVPGENLDVEVGVAGHDKPQRLVTLTATQTGELRAERTLPEKKKK